MKPRIYSTKELKDSLEYMKGFTTLPKRCWVNILVGIGYDDIIARCAQEHCRYSHCSCGFESHIDFPMYGFDTFCHCCVREGLA